MIALNTIMWSLATSHLAVSFNQNYRGIFRDHGVEDPTEFENNASPWICTELALENVNVSVMSSLFFFANADTSSVYPWRQCCNMEGLGPVES